MERPGESQVSEAEAREHRGLFRDIYVTFEEILQPPAIQLKRQNTSTGAYVEIGEPFTPAYIELSDRMEQQGGFNTGLVATTQTGTFAVTEAIVDDIGIERDDRFTWDGTPCVVTLVHPEADAIGYREVEFEFKGGR